MRHRIFPHPLLSSDIDFTHSRSTGDAGRRMSKETIALMVIESFIGIIFKWTRHRLGIALHWPPSPARPHFELCALIPAVMPCRPRAPTSFAYLVRLPPSIVFQSTRRRRGGLGGDSIDFRKPFRVRNTFRETFGDNFRKHPNSIEIKTLFRKSFRKPFRKCICKRLPV